MKAINRRGLKEASKVVGRDYRHIAIVTRGGNILAVGGNVTRHAEVAALSKLFPSERIGTTIFSARVRKDGSFAMGRPCRACMEFIKACGVKKVVWTDHEGQTVKVRLRYGA